MRLHEPFIRWTGALLLLCPYIGAFQYPSKLDVSGSLVVEQLLKLATFSDVPNPAVTRIVFTPNDMKARAYVKDLMQLAGLTLREDAVGNIFGLLAGDGSAEGLVQTGSHTDAIPLAGAYDGTLGVIGGIAALRALSAAGFRPRRGIEVIMFTSEEPTRFSLSCLGSRAMAGVLSAETLARRLDENGTDFLTAATAAGYGRGSTQAMLDAARVKPGSVSSFVELHIEQGPELEANGTSLGIVTAIAAPAALRVRFSGDGGHAGAQLMPRRNDAGLAAAELALAVEAAALGTGAPDTVATAGRVDLAPNTVNSVPPQAAVEIDLRDVDESRRDAVLAQILAAAEEIAARRRVRLQTEVANRDAPATCAAEVVAAATAAAEQLGASHARLVSRAYHDALFMAQIAPTGMIFIPCRGGWSHRPDEFASPAHVELGVKALALTLARLAGAAGNPGKAEL
ncbi:hypothetical protein WJX81_005498 [Elliptochloris bilobata]|uniref:Peptidase M20 dimerisation domain-containing protein n=1 Tax=Elliptochloris bilobata TaxID=381761 RepID=A0AAW1RIF4_9CHLO